jgi:DNA repair exonuclease SbcCD ATPase subunit
MHCISSSSNLPTLNTNPPDWSAFQDAYEQASADALDWVNTVMARLLDVPSEVQTYNDTITAVLQDASQQASTLITQPTNRVALAALKSDLNVLSSQLRLVTTFITSAIASIQTFDEKKLPDMATQLQSIAQKSVADSNVDQQKIADLNAKVTQLQNDIKSLTAQIAGLAIADGVALTVGVVATIALWPEGAAVWFVLGPAVAAATTFIALDAEQIKADKAAIQQAQQQMDGLTADVSTLGVLANNYTSMANQTQDIQANLQTVLTEWQTLENDVNTAIAEVKTALSDTTKVNFQAVANDLNQAVTEWNAAYAQAGSLALQLNVNNAQLQLGMSSSDVQAAMATGQTMDIIDYYNSAPAVA